MRKNVFWFLGTLIVCLSVIGVAFSAYHHEGEEDSPNFLAVYPGKAGTKLDQCTLCHSGGSYQQSGKTVTLGSCQWCHYTYGYDGHGNIMDTLNLYGKDYLYNGRNEASLVAIEPLDSDGDGYSNITEINANRYPGDPNDDPSKVVAPYRVYSMAQLEAMPQHTQFLLMNTSRSGDYYAEYSGVVLGDLLDNTGIQDTATGITVYSPDGWSQYHPLEPDPDPELYHVYGTYPSSVYYYDGEADVALNPVDGWCDYSAPSCVGRNPLDPIVVPNGLKTILAVKREGAYLEPGVLNVDNKLDGEGPFRVVPPQKVPSPPDQSSRAANQEVIWPYNEDWDHNAGSSTRTVTIIKVNPLPPGTTDIDVLEAGWRYVDEEKVIIYGAVEPGRDEVAADLGGNGIGYYDGSWTQITDRDPKLMASWFNGLAVGFENWRYFGLWNYNGTAWSRVTLRCPRVMTGWFKGLALAFGSGKGVWNYDGNALIQLAAGWRPEVMSGWSRGLAVGFVDAGLMNYDGSVWTYLHGTCPQVLCAWAKGLAVGFGDVAGLWSYDGTDWTLLHANCPQLMVGWSKGLAAEFGSGSGLWNYNGTSWSQIHGTDVVTIAPWDKGLLVGFGAGGGLWTYDGSGGWTQLSAQDAQQICGLNVKPD
jgi:hypothetical protein